MPMPDDFVTPEARYAQQAHEMSGAPDAPGMAPYPLYGLPTLGNEPEVAVPFYKKPVFCYGVGAVVGFGIGYAVFGFALPRMKKNPTKRRRTTRKKKPEETEEA